MAASSSAAHGPTDCDCGSCDTSQPPSILQCWHCFCSKRLGELKSSTDSQQDVVCPTCARVSRKDAVMLSPLPAFSSLPPLDCCDTPTGHSGYKCSTCTAELGVETLLCRSCKKAHDHMRLYSSHRLQQEPSVGKALKVLAPFKTVNFCSEHRDHPVTHRCQYSTPNGPANPHWICTQCLPIHNHQGHTFVSMEERHEEVISMAKDLSNEIKATRSNYEKFLLQSEQQEESRKKIASDEITTTFNKLREVVASAEALELARNPLRRDRGESSELRLLSLQYEQESNQETTTNITENTTETSGKTGGTVTKHALATQTHGTPTSQKRETAVTNLLQKGPKTLDEIVNALAPTSSRGVTVPRLEIRQNVVRVLEKIAVLIPSKDGQPTKYKLFQNKRSSKESSEGTTASTENRTSDDGFSQELLDRAKKARLPDRPHTELHQLGTAQRAQAFAWALFEETVPPGQNVGMAYSFHEFNTAKPLIDRQPEPIKRVLRKVLEVFFDRDELWLLNQVIPYLKQKRNQRANIPSSV